MNQLLTETIITSAAFLVALWAIVKWSERS